MKLISLKLENFRQHEDSFLEFKDGITVISGTNGAGKSTILESIAWALYGVEAARGNKDSIKFNKAKPRSKVMVELVFILDNTVYKVHRYLDKAEIYIGDEQAPVVASQQEVTKYLTDKIGMNKNEFFNTYFTGQKELNFLKNQGGIERKKFISKVMGYEKIREAQEKARIDKNNIDKEISGLKLGLDDMDSLNKEKEEINLKLAESKLSLESKQSEFNKTTENLTKIEPEWEKIKQIKEKFDKLNWEVKSIVDKSEFLQKSTNNLTEKLKEIEQKQIKLSELSQIETEYKNLEAKIKEQEALQEKDVLRQKLQTRLEGLNKEIAEKQGLLYEIVKSGKEKKVLIEKLPAASEELAAINTEIQHRELALREIDKIKKQLAVIEEKGENGSCPTCERPLKLEYNKVTGNFKQQISELSEHSKDLNDLKLKKTQKEKQIAEFNHIKGQYDAERTRYAATKTEIDTRVQEIEKINKEIADFSAGFDIEQLKALRQNFASLRQKYEEYLKLKTEIQGSESLTRELNEQKAAIKELSEKQKVINDDIKALDYSEEKFSQFDKNFREIKEKFHSSREEYIKAESSTQSILKDLERIQKIEALNKEKLNLIKEKQEQFDLLYELDRFYGQLWEKLNDEVRPEIAELAGKFLSELTDNRYSMLEINDKYDVCLHDDGEIKPVISGGEEDIVNLCIRLAISQIIAYRSGRALSLLVLDEIFGSLDESRRYNVIQLLRNLTGSFEQIILITHIDDTKDEIDHIITIEYDPESGCSRIATQKSHERELELIG